MHDSNYLSNTLASLQHEIIILKGPGVAPLSSWHAFFFFKKKKGLVIHATTNAEVLSDKQIRASNFLMLAPMLAHKEHKFAPSFQATDVHINTWDAVRRPIGSDTSVSKQVAQSSLFCTCDL